MLQGWPKNIIYLPRFVINPSDQLEIHTFSDASDKACIATVYVLNIKKCVLIGVRATQFVLKQLELKDVPVTIESKRYERQIPPFDTFYVYTIQWTLLLEEFYQVNSKPINHSGKIRNSWRRKKINGHNGNSNIKKMTKLINNWTRMLRATVWALRFIKLTFKREISWLKSLSTYKNYMNMDDYEITKRILLRQAQSDGLTEDQIRIRNLYYDGTDKLWRATSRLENAEITNESKFPIYLPSRHHITELIIKGKHEELYHAGIGHTLCELRQNFWIPKGRSTVKRVINGCFACRRWRTKPYKLPPMPNLPETRVKRSKPFEQIGLDYMGPITIKHNNEKFKRWIALFTCFTTRAIHLELVENLSAESFMYVLRRFISRRGCPKLVLSDNASQFQP
uniref:Integrase catalytic domain-containing protein n=1 Tax=Loa loa TaxID=7209 RepID=A0A1I7VZ41_LOALO